MPTVNPSQTDNQQSSLPAESKPTVQRTHTNTWGWGKTALVATTGLATLAGTAYAGRSHLPAGVTDTAASLVSYLPSTVTENVSWASDALWDAKSRAAESLFSYGVPRTMSFDQAANCGLALGMLGGTAGYMYGRSGLSQLGAKPDGSSARIDRLAKELQVKVAHAALTAEATEAFIGPEWYGRFLEYLTDFELGKTKVISTPAPVEE